MKFILLVATLSALTLGSVNAAPEKKSAQGQEREVYTAIAEVTAKVKDIDYKTRKVTLQDPQGGVLTVTADKSIQNLDQVKKGDNVVVGYAESLVYKIGKGGKATAPVETDAVAVARPGNRPERIVARQVNASVLITNVDKEKQTVTFKDNKGETNTFKVQHPERLNEVKVGDTVDLTFSEAMAVSLQKKEDKKIQ